MIPSSEAAATGSATIVPTPASAIKPTAVTWVESGLLKATTVDDARLAVAPSPSPVGRSTPLSTWFGPLFPIAKVATAEYEIVNLHEAAECRALGF